MIAGGGEMLTGAQPSRLLPGKFRCQRGRLRSSRNEHFAQYENKMHWLINISRLRNCLPARLLWLAFSICVVLIFTTSVVSQRRVDDPDDQEDLNRELWEFAKHSPYESIQSYIKDAQRASRATQTAEVELPTGWRIAPAGTQVEVGRLPYEMVQFAGKLVVLNTGYYYQEPHEVSIVDPQTAQVIKTLKFNSLFPSGVVALDGDLYISGGFDQKVYRVDKNFEVVREYKVGGFVGGLAAVDSQQLAVAYMAKQKDGAGGFVGGGLAILNTETGQIEHEIKAGYYPYTVH